MKDTYINLFTDFGFKKLFGEENSKEHLIAFLNTLLPAKHHIQELNYTNNEKLGATPADRKAIFDLHCISTSGERFIVELQKAKQNYFKERSIFYATFPIQEQAEKGDWDFKLDAVYTIGILDFEFDEDKHNHHKDVVHFVQLKNQHDKVFYDKCTFIYLTLPNFHKTEDELESDQDKWFFLFKNLHKLQAVPIKLQQAIFLSIFDKAQIAKFNPAERQAYEDSLKYYRDLKNVIDTARGEAKEEGILEGIELGKQEGIELGKQEGIELGKQEGREEEKLIMVRAMLAQGLEISLIATITELSIERIQNMMQS
jgi:predicted transposase/invertase (TIGR01784 family)